MKIRTRFLISFLVVYGAGFYFLVNSTLKEIRPRYLETIEESLNDTAQLLASFLEMEMEGEKIPTGGLKKIFGKSYKKKINARIYQVTKNSMDLSVYVTDSDGRVLYHSRDKGQEGKDYSRWNDVFLTLRGEYGARSTRTDPDDPSTSRLHVAAPVMHRGKPAGVVTVIKTQDSVTLFMQVAREKVITGGIIAAAAFLAFSILVTLWLNRPIEALIKYVNSLKGPGKAPLPRKGPPEIKKLCGSFEEMRIELEGKKYIEEYIATLTHELKSPLTSIRGAAELLQEELPSDRRKDFHESIIRESKRIDQIIQRMLLLSSLERREGIRDPKKIDCAAIINQILTAFEPVIQQKSIKVTRHLQYNAFVRGDEFLLRQSIENLVSNAVNFSPEGSKMTVSLSEKGGYAKMKVENEGENIPEYALKKIYDRFFSLPARGDHRGTGLGLSLVKESAKLHGGNITIFNSEKGVTAELSLPSGPEGTGETLKP